MRASGRSKTVKLSMAKIAKLKRVNKETAQFFGITIEKRRLKITEKSVTKAKEALKDPDHLTDEIRDIYRQIISTHENGNSVNVNKLAAQFKKLTLSKLKKELVLTDYKNKDKKSSGLMCGEWDKDRTGKICNGPICFYKCDSNLCNASHRIAPTSLFPISLWIGVVLILGRMN